MNEYYKWFAFGLTMIIYSFTLSGIWKDKIAQSFASWLLWVALDTIALGSLIVQHGNWFILACYCTGGSAVVISLICKHQYGWTIEETKVLILVFVCMVIWAMSGPVWATISSTVAVIIAGKPQLEDAWKKPDPQLGVIFMGWTTVNILYVLTGSEWSIKERFYPGMMVPLCLAIAAGSLQKKGNVAKTN